MNYNQIIYQIYPLGFCDAPRDNDGICVSRILQIIDWIPHFQKLGITAILFNPIFESDRHGYDTRDFEKIDCRLGTNEDFKRVCNCLHEANIKIILDGVFNHVGRGFPFFQDVLEKKWDSPYKDWFHINFSDTNQPDGFWYEGWEGHQELVKLNMHNEDVKQYLISKVDQWIDEFGIDGLRLDVAYMVDRNFMHALCDHVRASHPEFFFLGEMIGGDYNQIMNDNLLDSVTNYECRKGLYSSFNSHNLFEIGHSLNRQFGSEPWTLYRGKHLLSFVDNHDVNRIASELEDINDLDILYSLMYAMPGIPCLYYGSEWGTQGKRTHYSDYELRPHFDSPEWNTHTDHLQKLNHMRLTHEIFTDGDYAHIYLQNEQMVMRRRNEQGQLTFIINIANDSKHINTNFEVSEGVDLFTNETIQFNDGIEIEGKTARFIYTKW